MRKRAAGFLSNRNHSHGNELFWQMMEEKMGIEQAPTEQGKESARGLKDSSKAEERHVEAEKGSDLAKGADRFEERARSSDGRSAGDKQHD
ncbi:hypothetical protein RHAB21_02000 [Pseudorhizobium halotolerans]|nr:hypothetical protein RHAB21_02000 [Pseudorhizobium halotolerans]